MRARRVRDAVATREACVTQRRSMLRQRTHHASKSVGRWSGSFFEERRSRASRSSYYNQWS